jgi:hypothetical protein
MVHYNINWMGPVSMDWFRERGLTHEVSEVLEEDQTFGDLKAGDTWTYEEITTYYCAGRIDIRDSSKEGYDGWDEYGLSPMHVEDWNALGDYLWDLTTETQLSYDQLIESFEEYYGKKIRWLN